MTLSRKLAAGIAGSLVLWAAALAAEAPDASSNPYGGIVVRNVFALKDPPPPAEPEVAHPPPKFSLTGITTILGPKVAMFRSIPTPGKGADASKQESYMLSEGQRQGEVEVVSIDETAGMVKIICEGTPMTLDFTNNAAKTVAVVPAPGPGGAPGVTVPGMPAGHPLRQTGEAGGFHRPIRSGSPAPGPLPGGGVPMGTAAPGMAAPGVTTTTSSAGNPAMSREESALAVEALRAEGEGPPLPPTQFTHLLQGANEQPGVAAPSAGAGAPPAAGNPGVPMMPPGMAMPPRPY